MCNMKLASIYSFLFSFMAYHQIFSMSKTMGDTSEAGAG